MLALVIISWAAFVAYVVYREVTNDAAEVNKILVQRLTDQAVATGDIANSIVAQLGETFAKVFNPPTLHPNQSMIDAMKAINAEPTSQELGFDGTVAYPEGEFDPWMGRDAGITLPDDFSGVPEPPVGVNKAFWLDSNGQVVEIGGTE